MSPSYADSVANSYLPVTISPVLSAGMSQETLIHTANTAIADRFRDASLLRGRLAPNTVPVYHRVVVGHGKWLTKHGLRFTDVERGDIEHYLTDMLTTNAIKRNEIRKPQSVVRLLKTLRHFYRWMHEELLIHADPTVGIRGPKATEPLIEPLEYGEVGLLLQFADVDGTSDLLRARNKALIYLVADLGLRIGSEALEILREDVESPSGGLVDSFRVRAKGRERLVPLTPVPRKAIEEYLALRNDSAPWLFINHYWQTRSKRKQLAWHGARSMLKRTALAAGLDPKRITWHALRRTAATEAVEDGMHQELINQAFGWSKMSTAHRYFHAAGRRAAVEAFRKSSLTQRMVRDGRLAG